MQTKTQLIEIGRHYFEDKSIKLMYATSDGNFFYEASKTYAANHARTLKTEVIIITRADLAEPKEKPKAEESKETKTDSDELAGLRKEAKKLKIKGFGIMKAETLKRKIAEINGTT